MTQPLSPERLAEILARDEVATPGPWSAMVIDAETTSLRAGGQTARDSVRISWMRNVSAGDADFIAHARDDVPALLAELDRLRLELTAVEESATRTRRADMDAPQPTPGAATGALYEALTSPQWDDVMVRFGASDETAHILIGNHRAEARGEQDAEVKQLRAQLNLVAEFVAARAEFITAINGCHDSADYNRWQGHAEARRNLAERLGLPVAWPATPEATS